MDNVERAFVWWTFLKKKQVVRRLKLLETCDDRTTGKLIMLLSFHLLCLRSPEHLFLNMNPF